MLSGSLFRGRKADCGYQAAGHVCLNGDVLLANPRRGGCSKMQLGVWSNSLTLTTGAKSIPAKQPWRQASSRSGPLRAEELSDSFREFRKHQ